MSANIWVNHKGGLRWQLLLVCFISCSLASNSLITRNITLKTAEAAEEHTHHGGHKFIAVGEAFLAAREAPKNKMTPKVDTILKAESKIKAIPVTEANPVAKVESKTEVLPVIEAKPMAKVESKTDASPFTEEKPVAIVESETEAIPITKANPPAKVKLTVEDKPITEAKPATKVVSKTEDTPVTDAKPLVTESAEKTGIEVAADEVVVSDVYLMEHPAFDLQKLFPTVETPVQQSQEAVSVLQEDQVVVVNDTSESDPPAPAPPAPPAPDPASPDPAPAKTTVEEAAEDNKDKIVNFVVSEAGKEKMNTGEENIENIENMENLEASAPTNKGTADGRTASIENKT